MEHVDEGTLHAWLDGALAPGESARVESHVASCKACSALAAEARGLVAASSRILSALDDVPAGVLPTASAVRLASVSLRKRSQWLRPQFAAAAVAVIAVSSLVVARREAPSTVTDLATPVASQQLSPDSPAVPGQTAAATAEQVIRDANAAKGVVAPAPTASRTPRRDETTRAVRSNEPPSAPPIPPSVQAPAPSAMNPAEIRLRGRTALLADSASGPPRAVADAADVASRNASASIIVDSLMRAKATVPRPRLPSVALDAEKIVGQETKRLRGEQDARTAQRREAASGASSGGPVESSALVHEIAGCYTIEPSPATPDAPVVRRIVLDTVAAGSWSGAPAWRVTVLSPATLRPVDFHWSLGADAQVVLFEIRDGKTYSWILDLPRAARSAAGIPARRAECPGA